MEKLEKLKNRYKEIDHPYWEKDKWIKKIDSTFTIQHYRKDMTFAEQCIYDLERALAVSKNGRISSGEFEEKIKVINSEAQKTIKWFNEL